MTNTRNSGMKRLFAWVLTLGMIFQIMPTTALADIILSTPLRAAGDYKITFMADGNEVDTLEVTPGAEVTAENLPAAPNKEGGYAFRAWMNGDAVQAVPFTPEGNMTLTAAYVKTWAVDFVVDGTVASSITVMDGEALGELPEAPEN